ncbi:MAG: magnesium transporter [Halanaerobiales bacterium]
MAGSTDFMEFFMIDYFGTNPKVAARPFVTTIIDISSLFIYFWVATLLMSRLL